MVSYRTLTVDFTTVRQRSVSNKNRNQSKPELKNLLEAQMLLRGMDARLKRVEKMLFIEGSTTTEQHTVT